MALENKTDNLRVAHKAKIEPHSDRTTIVSYLDVRGEFMYFHGYVSVTDLPSEYQEKMALLDLQTNIPTIGEKKSKDKGESLSDTYVIEIMNDKKLNYNCPKLDEGELK